MNYILAPAQNDILHYSKGSESKTHKYISRVFKKGRWVYTYAKNKVTGKKAVTNKDGTPYNPTVKTVTLKDTPKGVQQISTRNNENEGWHLITKALAENMTAETKLDGYTYFDNLMRSHMQTSVTNRTKGNAYTSTGVKQYTPDYKTSPAPYSPTIKTYKHYDNEFNYDGNRYIDSQNNTEIYKTSPTYKTTPSVTNANGTAYSPSNKTTTKTASSTKSTSVPYTALGMGTHINRSNGGSHSFGYSTTEQAGINTFNSIMSSYKDYKAENAAEKKKKEEEKKKKIYGSVPYTALGMGTHINRSSGGTHKL